MHTNVYHHKYIYTNIDICPFAYIYNIYIAKHVYIHIHVYMYIHIYVHVYMHIYTYIYIYTYLYLYIYNISDMAFSFLWRDFMPHQRAPTA